ncbi:unnamed protein product [Cochlearia groenlandica]
MIHGMCKAYMVEEAYDLFCSLKLRGVEPDYIAYKTMISGLSRNGMRAKADALMRYYHKNARVIRQATSYWMPAPGQNNTYLLRKPHKPVWPEFSAPRMR